MRNQPDNFFREKLANYHKPAPAGAWDRIETSLKKTEPKFAWLKVAASLLLLASVGYIIWPQSSESNKGSISEAQPELEAAKVKPSDPKIASTEKSKDLQMQATEKVGPAGSATAEKSVPKKTALKHRKPQKENVAQTTVPVPAPADEIKNSTPEPVSGDVVPPVQQAKKSSSITLTFTAEETEKYLDKNALAEATSKDRKSSTFKKLLKKANELTTNQDPFGELRVKKNEILALEFRNDKRGQNK
jgi:hypothetical protein